MGWQRWRWIKVMMPSLGLIQEKIRQKYARNPPLTGKDPPRREEARPDSVLGSKLRSETRSELQVSVEIMRFRLWFLLS